MEKPTIMPHHSSLISQDVLQLMAPKHDNVYYLGPPVDSTADPKYKYGSVLRRSEMTVVAEFKGFEPTSRTDQSPKGWIKDPVFQGLADAPAKWQIDAEGALWWEFEGSAPAVLWYDGMIRGDHAIWQKTAAMPAQTNLPIKSSTVLAELGAIWNGIRNLEPGSTDPWWLTLFGFNGWYTGYSGIEYLGHSGTAPDGSTIEQPLPNGHCIGRQLQLVPQRNYEIFAGRVGSIDFCFVDGESVMEHASSLKRPDFSQVALTAYGKYEAPVRSRVEECIIYQIPPQAILPFDPRDHRT